MLKHSISSVDICYAMQQKKKNCLHGYNLVQSSDTFDFLIYAFNIKI